MNLFILQAGGSSMTSLLMMGVLFVIMYFFFLRPQIKRQKEQNLFQVGLKKGDEVVTSSGIIGQITKVDENEIMLQVDPKTFCVLPKVLSVKK
ncbi:MAG: preprotein translocase subunit YajC [Saprospiraceae bacterium]|nr:preprotein translocase subunit YajC [Saprospiraceae bacterium]